MLRFFPAPLFTFAGRIFGKHMSADTRPGLFALAREACNKDDLSRVCHLDGLATLFGGGLVGTDNNAHQAKRQVFTIAPRQFQVCFSWQVTHSAVGFTADRIYFSSYSRVRRSAVVNTVL